MVRRREERGEQAYVMAAWKIFKRREWECTVLYISPRQSVNPFLFDASTLLYIQSFCLRRTKVSKQ